MFLFDPNTIDDWQRLGLSFKQSTAILKYLAKGGRFRKVEDLQKMYTITEKMYTKLYPYVRIESKNEIKPVKSFNNRTEYIGPKGKINGADSIALIQIKGIGASFAKRIVKYRDRVGGFLKKSGYLRYLDLILQSLKRLRARFL